MDGKRVAIIGGGAAGCFCSIELKRLLPSAAVTVFEAQNRALAKVAVTGGGRCNLTNTFAAIRKLSDAYPRGDRLMHRALCAFSNEDAMSWFRRHGVGLVVQEDQCVFPASQDAMQIVNTLLSLMRASDVRLLCNKRIDDIRPLMDEYDAVLVASGGAGVRMLSALDIRIENLVPSLFSFNLSADGIRELAGAVVQNCNVCIPGTSFRSSGPLLVTDWGMSGPSILKLSSYAARYLAERQYVTDISVNWTGESDTSVVQGMVRCLLSDNPRKLLSSSHPQFVSTRLWHYLLSKYEFREDIRCSELGSKGINRLCTLLSDDVYQVKGKNRFKDEFVTCGGVSLKDINISTMECRKYPGLYFAGEVLDVDAITGGFNLQAAWSTGYVAAHSIANRLTNNK